MTENSTTTPTLESKPVAGNRTAGGRLVILELSGGRVFTVNPDGSDKRIIITDCHWPDGVAADVEAGHVYWTNMGTPSRNDGSIERSDFDGQNRKMIVPEGQTFTPKQLHLDKKQGRLYWSDREGMRVMRSNLDGSKLETLVDSSRGDGRPGKDARKWCVGIAVDTDRGQIYWTQKGADDAEQGRIFRAGIEIPKGENAANRSDIEVLFEDLPEPIDLELDLGNRMIYWTDRGDPPFGNTVNRSPMDADFKKRPSPEILLTHLMEGIGIALDLMNKRMFITDLAGTVYTARLDGSGKKPILVAQGNITGIAYAEIPQLPTLFSGKEK
jgi:hypothetical protein